MLGWWRGARVVARPAGQHRAGVYDLPAQQAAAPPLPHPPQATRLLLPQHTHHARQLGSRQEDSQQAGQVAGCTGSRLDRKQARQVAGWTGSRLDR